MNLRPEVLGVRESPMVQIATIAESMPNAVKLCYGESDVVTPDFICRAASQAMAAGHTFYTHTAGYSELREAIADKVFELHGASYAADEVIATVGATAAIFTAIRACVGAGDNAIVIEPAYALFSNAVIVAGAEPRAVPLQRSGTRFTLDLDRVRAAIDAHTRMLIVNSPSNPTGWMMTVAEQQALCELAERHDFIVLADEVYERLVYTLPRRSSAANERAEAGVAPSFARIAPDKSRVIVVNSFSKSYNMTGWRLGWALADATTIRTLYKTAEFITSNPAAMVQQAGIVALRDGEAYVSQLRVDYAARRAQVKAALSAFPQISLCEPDGGLYAFFGIDGVTDSTAFTSQLLRETGLALTPGVAFGASGEGYIRLCFAAREQTITDALARLTTFMRSR